MSLNLFISQIKCLLAVCCDKDKIDFITNITLHREGSGGYRKICQDVILVILVMLKKIVCLYCYIFFKVTLK